MYCSSGSVMFSACQPELHRASLIQHTEVAHHAVTRSSGAASRALTIVQDVSLAGAWTNEMP